MSIPVNPAKAQPTNTALKTRLREFLYLNLITRPYKSGILRPMVTPSSAPSHIIRCIAALPALSDSERELLEKIERNLNELDQLEDDYVRAGCNYLRNVVLLSAELLEEDLRARMVEGEESHEVYWLRRNVVEFMEIVVASRDAAAAAVGKGNEPASEQQN